MSNNADPQTFAELGEIADFVMGQSPLSRFVSETFESGIPFIQGCADFGSITPSTNSRCTRPKKSCESGDVLISVRAPVGTLNIADQPYCIGRGLAAIRFREGTDQKFGWHLLTQWSPKLQRVAQGSTFDAIGSNELHELQVPEFDPGEQRQIVRILDLADEAIQKTEALISKLKQMKSGLLHDLLSRGIDENGYVKTPLNFGRYEFAPTEYSKASWELVTVGQLIERGVIGKVQDGNHGEKHPKSSDFVPEGIPFLMANDLSDGTIDFNNCHHIRRAQYESLRIGFAKPRNVLLSHKGTIGQTAIVPNDRQDVMLTPQVTYYAIADEAALMPEYLMYWFQSHWFRRQMSILAEQSTRKFLGITGQRGLQIILPPPAEQRVIVDRLQALDDRIVYESNAWAKQKQLKAGLANDLLTGKKRLKQLTPASA